MLKKLSKKAKKYLQIVIVTICLILISFYSVNHLYDNVKETNINTNQEFITSIKKEAVYLNKKYHVPASIIMAQAILESDFGRSELASKYYNLFGVKAGVFEPKVKLATKEYVNNTWITSYENFRVYKNWNQSLKEHTKLIVNGTSWNKEQYKKVIEAKNYEEAAFALERAGYATDPNYAYKLIEIIEEYKLYENDI